MMFVFFIFFFSSSSYTVNELSVFELMKFYCNVRYFISFEIFRKVVFCLALYTEEVNLQTISMI